MSLVILIPIGLIVLALILYYGRRHKRHGSGLGDRNDLTERPELRGTEQAKDRF